MNVGTTPSFVVGLGASAGGLEALEQFFDGAPEDSGGCFVVIMHLSRDFKSMLDELLARHTKMPVKPAISGDKLEANTVYVIQPATTIEAKGLGFLVHSRPAADQTGTVSTIDKFFKSLAATWGKKACGVILSGSGSDGSEGIEAIFEAGGFTCAQSPETAKFDSMPVAAIRTNFVRAIEAPEQLGATVVEGTLFPSFATQELVVSDHDTALAKILQSVVGVSNIDAGKYKHSMFERRVRKRMMHLQIGSLTAYARLVLDDPNEAATLAQTLLIGVTEFFRDPEAFEVIERRIIPELIRQAQINKRPIRIWSPGCATGQEAYSLALLFAKAFQDMPNRIEVQIFATDIKRDYLGFAGRGEFTAEQLKGVPSELCDRYFQPLNGSDKYVVDPEIRKMIIFAPHDILTDPPFTRLDMVTCRNLLIYFSLEAQQKIMSGFAFGLMQKGFLFLGSSETVGAHREHFEFIDAKNRIFRRTQTARTSPAFNTPIERSIRDTARYGITRQTVKMRETALQPAYNELLREYAPASLLVSDARELLHSFGDARRFLRPPEGVAHLDAAEMVDRAIKTPLVAGVERTLRDKRPITFSKVVLDEYPEKGLEVDIEIRPLSDSSDFEPTHVLVLITESLPLYDKDTRYGTTVISGKELTEERIEKLETELARTREALQSTIEEIETTNEELQSSNEELMSSNEELQSTNEELSSVNEELYSVNAEYHRQNDELSKLSTDFDLLLQSSEIGVVFLDTDLHITRFTSLAQDMFKFTQNDIGRGLATFSSPFQDVVPADLVRETYETGKIVEIETVDEEGTAWLARAIGNDNHQGGVLTLINIGRLREAEYEAQQKSEMLAVMQEITAGFYYRLAPDFKTIIREVGRRDYHGIDVETTQHVLDYRNIHTDDKAEAQKALANLKTGVRHELVMRVWHGASKDYRYVRVSGLKNPDGTLDITGFDVHDLVLSKQEILAREAILDGILRASPALVSYIDTDLKYQYVNHAYQLQWETDQDAIIGKTVEEFLPADVYAAAKKHITSVLKGNRQDFMITREAPNGEDQKLSVIYEPVRDKTGELTGFVTVVTDITKFFALASERNEIDKVISQAAHASAHAIAIVDTKSLLIDYANDSAMSRIGISGSFNIPDSVKITRLTPTWGDRRWSGWLKSIAMGKDSVKTDISVFGTNGHPVEADIFAEYLTYGGKSKVMIRVFDNYERAVMVKDLESRSRELAMSNRDLEQFASIVAHDLRAPLRHITQFSDMIEDELGNGSPNNARDHLKVVKDSADKMADMVDGLLDYSRLGLSVNEFEEVDLKAAVKTATDLLSAEIKDSGAKIKKSGLKSVYGSSQLLPRVFQNLIQNSIKYRKDADTPEISIKAVYTDDLVKIHFKDNGIGIPSEHKDRVFKLFQRLHSNGKFDGLGVGLATCQRIVELHEGRIYLDETYKDGACFIVELPLKLELETK